jgi:hypothetical protein
MFIIQLSSYAPLCLKFYHYAYIVDGGQRHRLSLTNISHSQSFLQQNRTTTSDETSSIEFVLNLAKTSSLFKPQNKLKRSCDSENESSAKRPALIDTEDRLNESTPTIDLVSNTAMVISDKDSTK